MSLGLCEMTHKRNGIELPPKPHLQTEYCWNWKPLPTAFVSRDKHVFKAGGARICTTTSRTMARRISNALNQYVPGDRGY